MKMRRTMQAGIATTALFVGAMGAMAAQGAMRAYYANDPVGRNVVSIESRAPLETMLTRTGAVTGEIHVNPENVLDNPTARFELDTASLETGIKIRDEHMRGEEWLDVAKYPKATFVLDKLSIPSGANEMAAGGFVPREENAQTPPVTLEDGKPVLATYNGTFQLHGVTAGISGPVYITRTAASKETEHRLPGDLLHVRAKFTINLSYFGIKVPEMAKLKIADTQTVTADIFTSTESAPPSTDAPKS